MVVLYFGQILTCLGVTNLEVFSSCFFDFFLFNLLLVRSHQAEVIVVNLSKDAQCAEDGN